MQTIKRYKMLTGALLAIGVLVLMGATKGLEGDPTRAEFEQLRARIEAAEGITVPLGGVIAWWGTSDNLPENFELCDGASVSTPGSPMLGATKPDLRDSFIKGWDAGDMDVTDNEAAGSNTIGERDTGSTALSIAQLPAHTHAITDPGHSHGVTDSGHQHSLTARTGNNPTTSFAPLFGFNSGSSMNFNVSSVGTGVSVNTATTDISQPEFVGDGEGHTHTIPSHDNRPSFTELYYIVRVK